MGIKVRALIVNRLLRSCGCDELNRMAEIHARVLEEFKVSFNHVSTM